MSSKVTVQPLLKAEELLTEARKNMGLENFPFESKLSMAPLISHWQKHESSKSHQLKGIANEICRYVQAYPSVLQAYDSIEALLAKHGGIMDALFSGVFPIVISENVIGYAAPPFEMKPFFMTEGMQKLLSDTQAKIRFEQFGQFDRVPFSIRACVIILDKFYGVKLDRMLPFLFSLRRTGSNMQQFFKSTSVLDYLHVKTKKQPPEISQEKVNFLLKHMDDEFLWLETISPDVFYFEGFFMSMMNDVTEVETLSRLRKKLLEPNSFLSERSARKIANLTRIYLSLPNVEVGISAMDYPAEKSLAHRYKIHYPIVEGMQRLISYGDKNSVYERACRLNRMQTVSDLKNLKDHTPNEQVLVEKGFRSLMVVPLWDHQKHIIGIMELASPAPYAFTHIKELKLKEILPLYDLALEESRLSVENRIQSVIQEQYTNIHPSILWKFTETAFNYLEDREQLGEESVLAPIIFADVYPLFGQVDINHSTEIRNAAVHIDVRRNLELVVEILDSTYAYSKFHLLKKFTFAVRNKLERFQERFDSSEESEITNLLVNDIHPVLKQIREQTPLLSSSIDAYFDQLDTDLEIIYDQRKQYEISLNKVNNTIASYIEHEEELHQKIIPHYFEKFKTDGIEYTIYIGQSLLQHDHFTIHHLHNLRLWQLKSMVELYRQLEELRPKLTIDMTLSYLILAGGNTLSIRFRMEEKHFDINGAHNIQYEVLKKRVDKATLLGSDERLRQPDKLAIVYLQDKEKQEYQEYIQYLIEENLLQPNVEELELAPVQGLQGVKALRVGFVSR